NTSAAKGFVLVFTLAIVASLNGVPFMGREFPLQHLLWMTQAPKARHRVRSPSRTNKAHRGGRKSVGRIGASVIRHFADNAPWSRGFVAGNTLRDCVPRAIAANALDAENANHPATTTALSSALFMSSSN